MDLSFFRNPKIVSNNLAFNAKTTEFFSCMGWMFLTLFISYIFITAFDSSLKYLTNISIKQIVLVKQSENLSKVSLLYVVLIAPLIEELIFRLNLNLKRISILFSLIIISIILLKNNLDFNNMTSNLNIFKSIIIAALIIGLGFAINNVVLENIKSKYYSSFFYLNSILFGLLHISNFYSSIPNKLLVFTPIYVLPQIIGGIFFGYIRLKNGFLWGVALHCIFNLPASLIFYLNQ